MRATPLPAGLRLPLSNHTTLILRWYAPDVLRVFAGSAEPARPSLAVVAEPDSGLQWDWVEEGDGIRMWTERLEVSVDSTGSLTFRRDGRELLRETGRDFPENGLEASGDRNGAEQRFRLSETDALYGLGQYQDGVMNRRGTSCTLIHGNVSVVVPFLVSTGGWGLLWDNASHTEFEDAAEGMRLWSEVADGVEYYVCAGDDVRDIIAGYRRLTGAAPLFPRGFYGFIQCRERYKTAGELVSIVEEYRRRQLPLDVIVQDWRYWGDMRNWSGMVHDPESFGDLPAAARRIHDLRALLMVSIWPAVGPDTAVYRELEAGGHLFPAVHWSSGKIYDAFDPAAREIYWRHAKAGLFDHGVDAWWMDGTEPEFGDCHDPAIHKAALQSQRDTAAGSWARVLNAYSLATTAGVYEGQRKASDDKRVFILSRSAFAGQQRHAAATWSGDISATWDTLARQIPAGLNFCAAGIPYWTTDNGGFFVRGKGGMFPEGCGDPAFRELYLRWTQYSVFCPLMRAHGTQTPREIWHYGEPGDEIHDGLVAALELRMRLLPYSYSLAHQTWNGGESPMLPLGLRFPDDSAAADVKDQFMYGPSLLVCPVVEPMAHAPSETIDAFTQHDVSWEGSNGVRCRVFDGLEAEEPITDSRVTDDFDFSWTGNNPHGVTSDAYRLEFSGELPNRGGGPDRLLLRVAGRIRLAVDGERLLDDWEDNPSRDLAVDLPASDPVRRSFVLEYGHHSGDAVLKFGREIEEVWELSADTPRTREVVLPPGGWFDFHTGERVDGGNVITADAPLSRIPVFVRGGSILPMGAAKHWQDEFPDRELEIRVYPGADAGFTLWEDAGNGYGYERGERSAIRFHWRDAANALEIRPREGAFPGMLEKREFRVRVIGGGSRTVSYTGGAVRVQL